MQKFDLYNEHIKIRVKRVEKDYFHWHDFLQIVIVLKGVVKIRSWARDFYLNEGDLIVVNPGEVHKVDGILEDNIIFIIDISKKICKKIIKDFDDKVIMCNSKHKGHLIDSKIEKLKNLINLFVIINYSSVPFPNLKENIYSEDSLVSLLEFIYNEFDYVSGGIKLKKFSNEIYDRYVRIRNIVDSEQNTLKISLKEIASREKISYNHLKKDIVNRYGYSYTWIRNIIRTERAFKKVVSSEASLMDICVECGYSDPKYFIKYFNAFYESKPSDVRKDYKINNYLDKLNKIEL
jgi:AraC-like DNA-binding protein